MKKVIKLILLAAAAMLLLTACGRSDLVLTVNEDGSFHATVNYGIVKEFVANDEVMGQVKALITDSLDQNNVPYTESEDDEYVTISVDRDFADLAELTSEEAWRGISFVPSFTAKDGSTGIWTRYEDGRLKLSGMLNTETFNAKSIVGDNEDVANFSGSLRIVLPSAAQIHVGGEDDGNNGYIWSGKAGDNVQLDLATEKIFKDLTPANEASAPESENGAPVRLITPVICLLIIIAGAVIGVLVYRKKKTQATENTEQ